MVKPQNDEDLVNTKKKSKIDLLSFIEKGKEILIALISLIALILGIYYIISSSMDKKMSIMPFSVPNDLFEIGYTDKKCSQLYLDEIKAISKKAKTLYAKKDFKTYEEELDITVPFIDKEISIGSAKSFIQKVFNIKINTLRGDIVLINKDSVVLTTKYNENPPVITKGKLSDLNKVIRKSVEEEFRMFDPYLYASYLSSIGEDMKSVDAIKTALSKEPLEDDKWAYNLWGTILMKYKFYKEAKQKFEKSKRLDTAFFLPYYNFGQLDMMDSSYTTAIAYYRKSITLNKKFEQPYIQLVAIYIVQNDLLLATKTIDTAIQINPQNGDCYIQKAKIFLQEKDTVRAIEEIDKAIEINNDKPSFFVLLATIKLKQKENESAQQLLSRAYQMDTTNMNVANLYHYSMIASGDTSLANSFRARIQGLVFEELGKLLLRKYVGERILH